MFATFRRSHNTLHIHEKRRGARKIHANTFFRVHLSDHDFACATTKVRGLSRFIWKVFPFIFQFSLLYKMSKSLSKTTLMSLKWVTAFKQEITRWRLHWSIGPPDDPLPETLVETLDQTNSTFYPLRYFLHTLFRRALLSVVSAR